MKCCRYCGVKLDDDAVFCSFCGRSQFEYDDQNVSGGNNKKIIITSAVIVLCVCVVAFLVWFLALRDQEGEDVKYSDKSNGYYDAGQYSGAVDDNEDYDSYSYRDCVIPYSSEAYVGEYEVSVLSDDELQEAINEIYARHGRIFDDRDIQTYFEGKDWYYPISKDIEKDDFNEIEKYNWEILTKERSSRESEK